MRATAQARKERVIAELVAARRGILDAVAALPPAKQVEVFLGVWSVKDLLAHLAGWDDANIEATQAIRAGRLPAFYAHYDPDWQTFNARLVAEYRRDDLADLLALVRTRIAGSSSACAPSSPTSLIETWGYGSRAGR